MNAKMNQEPASLVLAAGTRKWFEYHCQEGHDSSDAKIWYHSHQQLTIVRCLDAAEADEEGVGRVYHVRFDDGFEADVFEDEFMDTPKQFYRPAKSSPPLLFPAVLNLFWYGKKIDRGHH